MTNNDFSGWNVDAKNSPFTVGPNATSTNTFNVNEQNTNVNEDLLKLIASSSLSQEQKKEMKEIIDVAAEEVKTAKPKKAVLKGLLTNANTIINTATKSPELIAAFEKWSTFIGSFTQ